ncbi:MAG: hypothetical protein NMK33_04490 [Candidatus Cardinium sp.]|uniref:hypothetical protein n=1 Tax=Cardinium endosymbiont of Dermatophagoides farinae TaxID=2597823 RepID=UPI001183FCB5|nr:hypothetical protein [Cardinium endosymbiont of Dermatophagoides farinae]TSJ80693.1 hypothetical protein FPG78_01260 [Cardinium endosymbiont of Dermatophagoides farinae]UWW96685.1 MAG: hypothetical protein NMK33_04490 [Candidatus Cardinium sp.]
MPNANPKQKAEDTPSVSDHADQAAQACKKAKEWLNQSKQALADARASTIQSELEKFKQIVQDADQAAKRATKMAKAAAGSKMYNAQQAGEDAQAACTAAADAKKNAEEVKKIQLRYYNYNMYNARETSQHAQNTSTKRSAENIEATLSKLTGRLQTIEDNILEALKNKIISLKNTPSKQKTNKRKQLKQLNNSSNKSPDSAAKKLLQLKNKVKMTQQEITNLKRKDILEDDLVKLEAEVKSIDDELPENIKKAIAEKKRRKTKKNKH